MISVVRNFHFMWYQGLAAAPSSITGTPDKWQELNPTSRVYFWDRLRIERFIRDYYPSFWVPYEELGLGGPANIAIIKKCDFARLLILYHFGGMYADMDCVPVRPLNSLFSSGVVKHLRTPFQYSRNGSEPSVLGVDPSPHKTDFKRYGLILSREHCAVEALRSYNYDRPQHAVANTVIFCQKHNSDMLDLLGFVAQRSKQRVLEFAGPWAITRWLLSRPERFVGRVLVLPPYYFLWQPHDMGKPWSDTIALHLNRMDWVDHSKQAGWLE